MRDSNIELCRFISILLIVTLHSGFKCLGVPISLNDTSIPLLFVQALSNIGVDVFILITGFYSSKLKPKSFLNLAYICLFYAIVAIFIGKVSNQPFQYSQVLFITRSSWFIPSYLCLLAIAPFINKACSNISKQEMLMGGGMIGLTLTWFGWLPALPSVSIGSNNGCSVICFVLLYIIGRYIRLFGLPRWFEKYSVFIYILCSALIAGLSYTALFLGGEYESKMNTLICRIYANNNPLMIISAIAFFSFFKSCNIKNSKIVNHIAKSTLAVLLFHDTDQFMYFMQPHFRFLYNSYSGLQCVAFWISSIIVIGIMAILVDQIRIFSYDWISSLVNKRKVTAK